MTKKGANVINGIQNLKMAQELFEDFCRENPGSLGAQLFKSYSKKIDWIFTHVVTVPFLTDEVREGIRQEINSDVFAVPAINEKVALLTPDQREIIENTIDAMLAGENVKIIDLDDAS